MPDLTLYREDVALIYDALCSKERFLSKALSEGELDTSAEGEVQDIRNLRNKIELRLVQGLHPKREVRN